MFAKIPADAFNHPRPNLDWWAKRIADQDRMMMVQILSLRRSERKKKTTVVISPEFATLADEGDLTRTPKQHETAIAKMRLREDSEPERNMSEFDEQDIAVLGLINGVIERTQARRKAAQKKSTNIITRTRG